MIGLIQRNLAGRPFILRADTRRNDLLRLQLCANPNPPTQRNSKFATKKTVSFRQNGLGDASGVADLFYVRL
jgi:hypothetical protein